MTTPSPKERNPQLYAFLSDLMQYVDFRGLDDGGEFLPITSQERENALFPSVEAILHHAFSVEFVTLYVKVPFDDALSVLSLLPYEPDDFVVDYSISNPYFDYIMTHLIDQHSSPSARTNQ